MPSRERSISRRTVAAATAGGALLALSAAPATAGPDRATPAAATPEASPQAATVPAPTTAEVLPAYQDLSDAIRSRGQSLIDPLLAGNGEPARAALSDELRKTLSGVDLAAVVAGLQANQIRFSFSEVHAHWAGTVGPGTISGFFQQAGVRDTFTLTPKGSGATPSASQAMAASPVPEPYPAGVWSGTLDALKLPFEISFSGDAASPAATITIAEQGITGVPLDDVAFLPEAPFGAVTYERAIPLAPATHLYGQVREWAGGQVQIDLSLSGDAIAAIQFQPAIVLPEDPAAGFVSDLTYRLPWERGAWFVFWGGDTEVQNYHAVAPSQRHAYDILVWKDGATFAGDGSQNDHYWIWGQPLVAPIAGTVVEALNDQPDQVPGQPLSETDPGAFTTLHPAGNHIILQASDKEFVVIAHMQRGSVRVQKGDVLKPGDPIGLVGNSGNTSEPHLHIHVQNVADFSDPKAVSLPLVFSGLTVDGKPASGGELLQGTFAEPAGD